MHPLPHPEGNGTRPVTPDRRPATPPQALRVQSLVRCPGWTGSPSSCGWPWP
jgi:hypothetical protein